MKKKHKSLLILLLTAMIWGFAFVAQLVGASSVGSFTFGALYTWRAVPYPGGPDL